MENDDETRDFEGFSPKFSDNSEVHHGSPSRFWPQPPAAKALFNPLDRVFVSGQG
jgi:hypothetical protein